MTEKIEMNLTVRGHKKKIRCVETGREWDSIIDIAREFDLPYVSFAACIRNRGKYGAYHFELVK